MTLWLPPDVTYPRTHLHARARVLQTKTLCKSTQGRASADQGSVRTVTHSPARTRTETHARTETQPEAHARVPSLHLSRPHANACARAVSNHRSGKRSRATLAKARLCHFFLFPFSTTPPPHHALLRRLQRLPSFHPTPPPMSRLGPPSGPRVYIAARARQ